jgi:hypothetical protein
MPTVFSLFYCILVVLSLSTALALAPASVGLGAAATTASRPPRLLRLPLATTMIAAAAKRARKKRRKKRSRKSRLAVDHARARRAETSTLSVTLTSKTLQRFTICALSRFAFRSCVLFSYSLPLFF